MRIIKWVGGMVLVTGAVLTALLVGAAPGDAVYIKCYPGACGAEKVLTTADKNSLNGCLNQFTSGLTVASLDNLHCAKDPDGVVTCSSVHLSTATKIAYALQRSQRKAGKIRSMSGSNVTFIKPGDYTLTTPQATCLENWAEGVWSGIDKTMLYEFRVKRVLEDHYGMWDEHVTSSPTDFVDDDQAGRVRKVTGTVE